MPTPISRRQFLKSAGMTGVALSLASPLPKRIVADPCTQYIGVGYLDNPQLVELARNGMAPLWVAGQALNSFANHLRFIKLPSHLTSYLRIAGGDWKSISCRLRGYGKRYHLRFEHAGPMRRSVFWLIKIGRITYQGPREARQPLITAFSNSSF